MNKDTIIRFSDSVFSQEIDGEMVLLDMQSEQYFGLDAVGAEIWKLLETGKSVGQVHAAMLEAYDADPQTLLTDIMNFIASLLDSNLASAS